MATHGIPYPLESTTDADLRNLSQVLWGWKHSDCCCITSATQKAACVAGAGCIWARQQNLAQFYSFYRDLVASYVPDLEYGHCAALRDHNDLCEIIAALKARPTVPRLSLTSAYFKARHSKNAEAIPTKGDQERAFGLAARIITGVTCSGEDITSTILESGSIPINWPGDTSVSQSVLAAFPLSSKLSLSRSYGCRESQDMSARLTAISITKIGRLQFRATNDLRKHLELDAKRGILRVYQQTNALKEHLRASKDLTIPRTSAEVITRLVTSAELPHTSTVKT